VEAFGVFEMKAGGLPFYAFCDYAHNTEADGGKDDGFLIGCQVGKTKKPGSWEFQYNYRELEDDCVVGALTDSDFNGGGTGGEGHQLKAGYQINKKAKLGVTYILSNDVNDASSEDTYRRLQVDFKMKF
ncbi:MAG: putative porin, partial [Planctomycetota bacterium]